MKYLVKVSQTEEYLLEYVVEANSKNEAEEKVLNTWDYEIISDDFVDVVNKEITEVEPYNEDQGFDL